MRTPIYPTMLLCVALMTGFTFADAPDAGLSVSLPLKDLRALLDHGKAEEPAAPVDVVFGPAAYSVVAGDKNAEVTVTADLTLPNARWILVPLGSGAGMTGITIDDQPAAVIRKDGKLMAVVDARKNHTAKLKLTAQLPVNVHVDVSTLTLPLLPAPIGTLGARLPAANLNVKSAELLAMKVETAGGATTVSAALPQVEAVTLQWSAHDARPARVTVQQLALVSVDRGILRYTVTLQYDIQHASVEKLQVKLPDGVDLTQVTGEHLADYALDEAAKPRVLVMQLNEPTKGHTSFTVQYEHRLKDDQLKPALTLATPMDVAGESGFVGIEVRGNYEVNPAAENANRMDVAQLPDLIHREAVSPVRFAYRYDKPGAVFSVALRPLQDLDVLIAMSDVTEVSTTVTPEGQIITKMIMIVRNNQKSHLRVTLPSGAQIWSVFVDDRPATPSKDEKGDVLVPLSKSRPVAENDDNNYINQRDLRRSMNNPNSPNHLDNSSNFSGPLRALDTDRVSDLKPYDVELVYVSPAVQFADRGQLKLELPKVDIPIGQLAWAVFLPKSMKVVDETGSIRQVDAFSIPFRHFGEAGLANGPAQLAKVQEKLQDAAKQMLQPPGALGSKARGVEPVRIEIPIVGTIYRFEKTLAVNEAQNIELTYVKRN